MRVIIVDNNQFCHNIEDVVQIKFNQNNFIIELPNLKFKDIPLNEKIESIGCQDIGIDEITDLQSQLAEKDKEIEYQENMKILAVDNQNKKAIEQLEKVKEKFGYKHNSQLVISSKNLVEFIDQQINELKGM